MRDHFDVGMPPIKVGVCSCVDDLGDFPHYTPHYEERWSLVEYVRWRLGIFEMKTGRTTSVLCEENSTQSQVRVEIETGTGHGFTHCLFTGKSSFSAYMMGYESGMASVVKPD